MGWFDIRRVAGAVLLALYAGAAMPGGACLLDCALSTRTESDVKASHHCDSEPSFGAAGGACHASLESPDEAAPRAEYRLASAADATYLHEYFSLLPNSPIADAHDGPRTARAAHGPPGSFSPLRV